MYISIAKPLAQGNERFSNHTEIKKIVLLSTQCTEFSKTQHNS